MAEAVRAGLAEEVLVAAETRRSPGLQVVAGAAAAAGVPVRDVARGDLDAMAPEHQDVVARVRLPRTLSEQDLHGFHFGPDAVCVVLDGITDPQNLGAAARSAEAAGVDLLVTRERRAAAVTPAAVRASAGALLHLPHARVVNLTRTLGRLADDGFTVVGLDQDAVDSIYDRPCPDGRLALVVGSEGEGISRLVRESCDLLVRLPMRGHVASLNASASLAAALFGFVLPSRRREPSSRHRGTGIS